MIFRKYPIFSWVAIIVAAICLVSCNKQDELTPDDAASKLVQMTFSASTSDSAADAKTHVNLSESSSPNLYWNSGDAISVLPYGSNGNDSFGLTAGDGLTCATFTGTTASAAKYYALYPYQSGVTLDGDVVKNVDLPRRQVATPGTFDPRCNLMVAVSNGTDFSFKQVCSYIKVTPAFACKQITIKSNNNGNALTGKCNISLVQDGTPAVSITKDTAIVSLVPAEGLISAGNSYLIAVYPGALSSGFMVSFTAEDDKVYIYKYPSSVTLLQGNILNIMGFQGWSAIVDYVQLWEGGPKWATVNLGATSTTESGDYFAWGEIEPYYNYFNSGSMHVQDGWRSDRSGYFLESYPFSNTTIWDNSGVLLACYDAATQLWGGSWSMPTEDDFDMMIAKCTLVYDNVRKGVVVSGKDDSYSNKSIFLPFVGSFAGSAILSSNGVKGVYWTAKRNQGNSRALTVGSDTKSISAKNSYHGCIIRPVIH